MSNSRGSAGFGVVGAAVGIGLPIFGVVLLAGLIRGTAKRVFQSNEVRQADLAVQSEKYFAEQKQKHRELHLDKKARIARSREMHRARAIARQQAQQLSIEGRGLR